MVKVSQIKDKSLPANTTQQEDNMEIATKAGQRRATQSEFNLGVYTRHNCIIYFMGCHILSGKKYK